MKKLCATQDKRINQNINQKKLVKVEKKVNTATEIVYEENKEYDFWGIPTYATREEAISACMAAHPAGKSRESIEVMQSSENLVEKVQVIAIRSGIAVKERLQTLIKDDQGDVPGWVLVVLMTTGLVTAIWAIAKPNLTNILNNSLNSMNNVR